MSRRSAGAIGAIVTASLVLSGVVLGQDATPEAVAALRAEEAGVKINLAYTVPKEGSNLWFDAMLIPKDAPNPENAHLFLNYMMRPEVIAKATDYVSYANGNKASKPLISPDILNDPAIYPDAETQKRMFQSVVDPSDVDEVRRLFVDDVVPAFAGATTSSPRRRPGSQIEFARLRWRAFAPRDASLL